MFQGSENIKKFEHTKYVEANGGTLNGSTRLDFTNYYETLPSNRVELGLWLESDRMRSLDINAENLKNQQNVVSEEVRVNVLNQPYALFEVLDLWMNANQNWYNAHNFYGDLKEINAATLDDVKAFFKSYYVPSNAVLTVVGDVNSEEVKVMIEKYFSSIPSQPTPVKPDISEPVQTKEKRLVQTDKLANLPAIALGYHLPAQNTPDYAAMVLLNIILQGDDGARLYQRLIKQKEMALSLNGGINILIGNEFDYNGPMLLTSKFIYKAELKADTIVKEFDFVVDDVIKNGVTAKELEDAKVRFRSNYYDQLESTFGKANLLASFALFNDNPNQINVALDKFEEVSLDQIKTVAKKYLVPENRTIIDRIPEKKEGK
jgi:predicted Zn-dependent peptidase